MDETILATLIANVKRECAITWTDNETEEDVERIVRSAVPVMAHKLGVTETGDVFTEGGYAKMLFEKYCHYVFNNVPDEFEENYKRDIIAARHLYMVNGSGGSHEDGETYLIHAVVAPENSEDDSQEGDG